MSPRGVFVVVDGPSGVGKSTVTVRLADRLTHAGHAVVATREPSDGPIGTLARGGTHTYRGPALACLVAADRYQHLDTVVRPALDAGQIVVCDRYLPSSLVLQSFDGVPQAWVWHLNRYVERPDLTVLLTGDPDRCRERAAARGLSSRFHGTVVDEVGRYRAVAGQLTDAGYRTVSYDVREQTPDQVARALVELVRPVLRERDVPRRRR